MKTDWNVIFPPDTIGFCISSHDSKTPLAKELTLPFQSRREAEAKIDGFIRSIYTPKNQGRIS
jgi:hypothetical protein